MRSLWLNLLREAWKHSAQAFRPPRAISKVLSTTASYAFATAGIPHATKPIRAYLVVTDRCNNRCLHCERHSGGHYDGASMDFRRIQELSDALPLLLSVCLVAHGEPLLYPKLLDGIRLFVGRGCWVNIVTNGILLSRKKAEELVASGLPECQISLDGASDAMIRRMRPDTDPIRVKENIKYLVECSRRARGTPMRTVLSFCITGINVGEIESFVRLGEELGVDMVRFQKFVPFAGSDPRLILENYGEAARLLRDLHQSGKYRPSIVLDDIREVDSSIFRFVRARCVHPFLNISVSTDGKVFPCCQHPEQIGDLTTESVQDVLEGETRRRFMERINSDDPPQICRQCPWLHRPPTTGSGARATAQFEI